MTVPPPVSPHAPDFTPDWTVSPGAVLQTELEDRSMSQADLAARTGLTPKHINQVIKGTASLSSDVAVRLELALGIPSILWGRLEADWQDHRSHQRNREQLATYTDWAAKFPLREMRERGLPVPTVQTEAVQWLLAWFRVADPGAFADVFTAPMVSFRRSQKYRNDPVATAVWLRLAEKRSRRLPLEPWNPARLRRNLGRLRSCVSSTHLVDGFERAQQVAADCGLALVFVEEFDGTRASGATRWLRGYPLVALSSRNKKADGFWFTLFHELGHVLHDPKRATYIDLDGMEGDDSDGREDQANEFAVQTLLPHSHDMQIRAAAISDLPRVAEQLGVDLGLVAGRRGHLTREWAQVARFRPSIDWSELERLNA